MVRADDGQNELTILLPELYASSMSAKGFVLVDCAARFASIADRQRYRDSVCEIASSWREELQQYFERQRGERPAVLCGMAEEVVGQWGGQK